MALTLRRRALSQKVYTQDPGTGAWDRVTTIALPWQPNIRPSTMRKNALKPYYRKRFSKLFQERRYAQNYPLQPFRLFDLPGEVRNQVYREILVLDQAIELAPKSTGPYNSRAHTIHLNQFKYDIIPRLRLLRTSKAVHAEATSTFYAENEFRFTNVDDWYILSSLLLTIGRQNSKLIRNIAVHVPWHGKALDNRHDGLPESNNKMLGMQGHLRSMGLRYKWRWSGFCATTCIKRCKKIFEKGGALKSVSFILPDSYQLPVPVWDADSLEWPYNKSNGYMDPQQIFDESKFAEGFKTSLVRLHGGFYNANNDQQVIDHARLHVLQTHVDVWDWFEIECSWEVKTMVYDRGGYYPAPLKEGDEIQSLWELPDII